MRSKVREKLHDGRKQFGRYSRANLEKIDHDGNLRDNEQTAQIIEDSAEDWIIQVEDSLDLRNEKAAAAAFSDILNSVNGMQKVAEILALFETRRLVVHPRQKELFVMLDELREIQKKLADIQRRVVTPARVFSYLVSDFHRDILPREEFLVADLHYAAVEVERASHALEDLSSEVILAVGPDKGGRAPNTKYVGMAPLNFLAYCFAVRWRATGRSLRHPESKGFVEMLRAIYEVVAGEKELPEGGKVLLAYARMILARDDA